MTSATESAKEVRRFNIHTVRTELEKFGDAADVTAFLRALERRADVASLYFAVARRGHAEAARGLLPLIGAPVAAAALACMGRDGLPGSELPAVLAPFAALPSPLLGYRAGKDFTWPQTVFPRVLAEAEGGSALATPTDEACARITADAEAVVIEARGRIQVTVQRTGAYAVVVDGAPVREDVLRLEGDLLTVIVGLAGRQLTLIGRGRCDVEVPEGDSRSFSVRADQGTLARCILQEHADSAWLEATENLFGAAEKVSDAARRRAVGTLGKSEEPRAATALAAGALYLDEPLRAAAERALNGMGPSGADARRALTAARAAAAPTSATPAKSAAAREGAAEVTKPTDLDEVCARVAAAGLVARPIEGGVLYTKPRSRRAPLVLVLRPAPAWASREDFVQILIDHGERVLQAFPVAGAAALVDDTGAATLECPNGEDIVVISALGRRFPDGVALYLDRDARAFDRAEPLLGTSVPGDDRFFPVRL